MFIALIVVTVFVVVHMSKCIKLYSLNMCSLSQVYYTAITLLKTKEMEPVLARVP